MRLRKTRAHQLDVIVTSPRCDRFGGVECVTISPAREVV